MIKDNQKLLNLMHVIVDAIIIALSYILAWSLRFEDTWSPLVQWRIIPAPIGYIRPRQDYINMLVFLVPCYLIIYYFCNLYNLSYLQGLHHLPEAFHGMQQSHRKIILHFRFS